MPLISDPFRACSCGCIHSVTVSRPGLPITAQLLSSCRVSLLTISCLCHRSEPILQVLHCTSFFTRHARDCMCSLNVYVHVRICKRLDERDDVHALASRGSLLLVFTRRATRHRFSQRMQSDVGYTCRHLARVQRPVAATCEQQKRGASYATRVQLVCLKWQQHATFIQRDTLQQALIRLLCACNAALAPVRGAHGHMLAHKSKHCRVRWCVSLPRCEWSHT